MWQATEPTSMCSELRRVCGLPVEAGILFTNAQGAHSSRIETGKTQLLAQMTFLRKFLEEDEHILYVATAYSPMDWHTMGAMHGLFPLLTKQAVLVFTDRRFFHVPTTRLYEYRGSVAQAWYRDCSSMRVLRRATYLTLYLQYASGLKESFRQIASADGAKITQLAAHVGDFASAGDTGGSSASRERHHLCPRCTQVLRPGVWTCPACGLEFKNDREATTWSLAVLGGGFFYGRHPGLGMVVALMECAVVFTMLMGAHRLIWGIGDPADSASLLGIAGVFLAAMKLSALGAARQFVAEFLPQRLKPLLDEAKVPDGPVLPRMRDPLMQGLMVSLVILLGFVVFDRWRATGPGAPPAPALPSSERVPDPRPRVRAQTQAPMRPLTPVPPAPESPEDAAIQGLRECALLTGRYPESLESRGTRVDESIQQVLRHERSRMDWFDAKPGEYNEDMRSAQRERVQRLEQKAQCIDRFESFGRTLRLQQKEPVYYGKVVGRGEGERVLLRWQSAPNEYRVIFGDLRAETVSAERLAQLEATQAQEFVRLAAPLLHPESAAIEGLRECAALFGRYPESPDAGRDGLWEDIRQLTQNALLKTQSTGSDTVAETASLEQRIGRISRFGTFCAILRGQEKEPVYYGKVVKPGEAERVLLRWQLAPNQYRVIFGDLHTEYVTAARLAQLEATLPK